EIFDTTLRDGSQREGLSLTVSDKLRIAEQLDYLGVDYIEGGWPGANPKDDEFFTRVLKELEFETAELVAFGATRRAGILPDAALGVHFHNDAGCAVANALASVRAGAMQVQGCMNGFGERCGNADLTAIIPNLVLKMGIDCLPVERLPRLTPVAHHIAEVANVSLNPQNPYVGDSAFATKAGIHTSALARRPDAYEHVVPETVGNGTRIMVSELSGRSTVLLKARQTGIDLESRPEAVAEILRPAQELEHAGYHFEAADGAYELLVRRA